jgi:hypothetical protein
MDLAAAVAPTTLARERTLPVHDALAPLLPDGALVRGRSLACEGVTATSLALALAAGATAAGAWLAVVDVPWLGVEAAAELGVPLERLVRVEVGAGRERDRARAWADLQAAVIDGFELVISRVPAAANPAVVRRVQTRMQSRGAVVILVGASRAWSTDLTLRTTRASWEGVAEGHGHLRARRVAIEATGRRVPRPRQAELWLPGPGGSLAAVTPAPASVAPAVPAGVLADVSADVLADVPSGVPADVLADVSELRAVG